METELTVAEVREPLLDRSLVRLGLREDVARIVAATPSLRAAWLLAAGAVVAFALWGDAVDPHLVTLVAILAPMLPIAGVAAAYGPWADPMFEMTQASPTSGFRVLLLRSVAVLVAGTILVAVAAVAVPGTGIAAVAWVLPALALCSASLMLATFMPLIRASAIVSAGWLLVAAGVASTHPATTLFRGPAQVAFFAVTVASCAVLARRQHHLDIANLRTRRALVDAADAERRRIERNLHDGAQQQLVAIGVKAGLARALLAKDPAKAGDVLDQIRADADGALRALREMTRGAYPPILADDGLAAALAAAARTAPVAVSLDVDASMDRLPKDVEIAAYFCCTEAIQNAVKHADAASITVSVRLLTGRLCVRVVDDGAGFDPSLARRGVGLRSMEDRVAALGGTLEMLSSPGGGTTLSVELPTVQR